MWFKILPSFSKMPDIFRLSCYQKDRIVTFVFITENPSKLLFLNYSELIIILQFSIIASLKLELANRDFIIVE